MARWIHASLLLAALAGAPPVAAQTAPPDGAHDFDWELGTWTTQVRVRAPLSTADAWTEFRGTSVVRPLGQGRADVLELSVASGDRRIEGISLRLYNPITRQWSLNFANLKNGILTSPVFGGFKDGKGAFYGQDTVDGRVVSVRFEITMISSTMARFEQAFSVDGGRSWIVNWVATDTRTS